MQEPEGRERTMYEHKAIRGEGGTYYGSVSYRPADEFLGAAWIASLAGWGRPRWVEGKTQEEARAKLLASLPAGSTIQWEGAE